MKNLEARRRHGLEQVVGHLQDSGYLKEKDIKLGQDYRGLEWPGSQRLRTWILSCHRDEAVARSQIGNVNS